MTGAGPPRVTDPAPTTRPMRISSSRESGAGARGGGLSGPGVRGRGLSGAGACGRGLSGVVPGVQLMATPTASAAAAQPDVLLAPVVPKFQLDLEILTSEKSDDGLQFIP